MSQVPQTIGKYTIVESIGQGGMGKVFKARHPTLDRHVILKQLNISNDPTIRERFRREAEIMIDFRTDYVVDVYDHFREFDTDYIVLEYVDGKSLDEIIQNERYLDCDLALLIARDVARGLKYVHSKGVTHRDVKPGNVLIGRDGAVRLLDFGIASRSGQSGDDLTKDGMTLGTVSYIAPEQIEHSRNADQRGDIYSFGAMLYEMVTGKKAFPGSFSPETVNRIQRGRYRRPRRVNPQVTRFVARLIRRTMHRKPRRRYQDFGKVLARIDRQLKPNRERAATRTLLDLVSVGRTSSQQPPPKKRPIWRGIVIGLAVVLLAAFGTAWATGIWHKLVHTDTHGWFAFQIRLRDSAAGLREHHISIDLYRVISNELIDRPVRGPLLLYTRVLQTPDYSVLTSRPLFVSAGTYESQIRIDGQVTRRRFVVLPFAESSGEVPVVRADWDPTPVSELALDISVRDALTDDDLTGTSIVSLSADGNEWVTVAAAPGDADVPDTAGTTDAGQPSPFMATVVGPDGEPVPQGESDVATGVDSLNTDESVPGLQDLLPDSVPEVRYHPGDEVHVRVEHPGYSATEMAVETDRLTTSVSIAIQLVPRTN